jgi:tRNA (cytidine/uridine-2'-O-)-methyltransferase
MSQDAPCFAKGVTVQIGFFQPDIPQNLGAALRLGACFAAPVEIIEPCGFPLTDRAMRRSAMDYGARAEVVRHGGWDAFCAAPQRATGRLILFTTRAEMPLGRFRFLPGDTLLFGRESAGVPDEVHEAAHARVVIPLASGARSLNVAMAAGIALWEALRQTREAPPD